jgi:hypothetical protein
MTIAITAPMPSGCDGCDARQAGRDMLLVQRALSATCVAAEASVSRQGKWPTVICPTVSVGALRRRPDGQYKGVGACASFIPG